MTDLQAEVQAAADEMVATSAETGLQVAVNRYGQVIADAARRIEPLWPFARTTVRSAKDQK